MATSTNTGKSASSTGDLTSSKSSANNAVLNDSVVNETSSLSGSVESSSASTSMDDAFKHMQGAVESVKRAARSLGHSSSATADIKIAEGKERLLETSDKADKWVKDRPYATLGIAFAAGAVLASLMKK